MENNQTIKYVDDDDKCYGVAGMIIALTIKNKEYHIESVSVDRPDIDSISFYPDYDYTVNQRLSAKSAWRTSVEHFEIACSVLIANILCRDLIYRRNGGDNGKLQAVFELISQEGIEIYQLERDECKYLFNTNYHQLIRAFSHPAVAEIVVTLYSILKDKRTIYRSELLDVLSELS